MIRHCWVCGHSLFWKRLAHLLAHVIQASSLAVRPRPSLRILVGVASCCWTERCSVGQGDPLLCWWDNHSGGVTSALLAVHGPASRKRDVGMLETRPGEGSGLKRA